MIDELRDEQLIEKVGGRFRLSTLIQKRLVYLNKGARSFVESDKKDKLQIVIQEILEDKIYLDMNDEVCARDDQGNELGPVSDEILNLVDNEVSQIGDQIERLVRISENSSRLPNAAFERPSWLLAGVEQDLSRE